MKVSPILQADKTKENIQKYTDQWRRNFANGKNNKNSEFWSRDFLRDGLFRSRREIFYHFKKVNIRAVSFPFSRELVTNLILDEQKSIFWVNTFHPLIIL